MIFLFSETFQFLYQFFFKKSRFIGAVGLSILAYLAINWGSNALDYQTYSDIYYYDNQPGTYYFEKGYSMLGEFFLNHGFSYNDFRTLCIVLSLVVLFIAVNRFTKNIAFFTFFFGITAFFSDTTQIRNFMMISLVLLAFSFLINVTTKNILISVMVIILSAQFQSLGYIFLIAVGIRCLPLKRIADRPFETLGIMLLFMLVGLLVRTSLIKIISNVAGLVSTRDSLVEKVSEQYTYGSNSVQLSLVIFSTILGFLIGTYLYKNILLENLQNEGKADTLYSGIVLSLFMLPLLFMAIDYARIQRGAWYFIMVTATFYFGQLSIDIKKKWLVFGAFVVTSIVFLLSYTFILGGPYRQSIPYLLQFKH
ncbi:EpsG family protein [Pediococcus ethanolidurans]|uniref:EpsG family protein n=1 Tax=Pediococcus ethanolidurans TaxID=319653 RepID=UPI0021E90941|nr:EpsG family protein [Pediococcus ethanolidurans]MCV3324499.1 EpsG family protein [Pediococcus ethanolidurans]